MPVPRFVVPSAESEHSNGVSGFYVLNLGTKEFIKIVSPFAQVVTTLLLQGRGHEADIRLVDISVSRIHASLRLSTKPRDNTLTSEISQH